MHRHHHNHHQINVFATHALWQFICQWGAAAASYFMTIADVTLGKCRRFQQLHKSSTNVSHLWMLSPGGNLRRDKHTNMVDQHWISHNNVARFPNLYLTSHNVTSSSHKNWQFKKHAARQGNSIQFKSFDVRWFDRKWCRTKHLWYWNVTFCGDVQQNILDCDILWWLWSGDWSSEGWWRGMRHDLRCL